jgi:hypothetical protein
MLPKDRRFAGLSPHRGALALILVAALALRLHSISFGLPAITDMDELMFELGALRMIGGGQLNPEWFGHPATTTMYLLALIAIGVFGLGVLTGRFADIDALMVAVYNDPGVLVLPQRIAIALFAVLGIALAYRLACRLFARPTGLATAAILAVSPMHVHYSQLIRSDMMATTFMLGAMLCALAYARSGERRAFVCGVLGVALAITTKWPFALAFLALLGALVLRWRSGFIEARALIGLSAAAALGTLVAMVLISPFLLIEFDTVIANLRGEVQEYHLGATGGSVLHNAWWYAKGPLVRALGLAGLALASIGLWLARGRREAMAIALIPGAAMYLLACSQNIVWERWVLAVVPLLAMLAAHALVQIACAVRERWLAVPIPAVLAALLACVLVLPLLDALADGRERMNDTRLQASAWLRRNVTPGKTILVEHFAFDLVDSPYDFVFPLGAAGCKDARGLISGRVDNTMVESARKGRTNIDIGTVEPALLGTCRADYAVLSQHTRYIAERERFPREYAAYRRFLDKGVKVAEFMPKRGVAGGWPVVILRLDSRAKDALEPPVTGLRPSR